MRLDLSRCSNRELLSKFSALVEKDRTSTAELLAYMGEIEARRLYVPAGYASMYRFCVGEFQMSEDVSFKRIRVARLARRFPGILDAIADGRLHLSGLVSLSPYKQAKDFEALLEAAAGRTKAEIELLLAQRFPRADVPTVVRPLSPEPRSPELAPGPVTADAQSRPASLASDALVPGRPVDAGTAVEGGVPEAITAVPAEQLAPGPVAAAAPRATLAPLAPRRFALQVTVGQGTHDKLRRAQELLGFQVSHGDLASVLDLALDALLRQLERAKFAATEKPKAGARESTAGKRHVPHGVQREVWKRDGGQCTFVSERGRRCEERRALEYDHVQPFARGGEATVEGIRLRCRAHNLFEAERAFGAGFMRGKRKRARQPMDEAQKWIASGLDRTGTAGTPAPTRSA